MKGAARQVDDKPIPGPFVRGLTIGVLIGAAIGGSRIWQSLLRRRLRRA
jgi:hypothetical protein